MADRFEDPTLSETLNKYLCIHTHTNLLLQRTTYKRTQEPTAAGKVGSSLAGLCMGPFVVFLGCALLWYNEGVAIKTHRSLNEALDAHHHIDNSHQIDNSLDRKVQPAAPAFPHLSLLLSVILLSITPAARSPHRKAQRRFPRTGRSLPSRTERGLDPS